MEVSRAELVNVKNPITDEIEQIPHTFFSLSASEKMQYNSFRIAQDTLEKKVNELRNKRKEIKKEDEKKIQEEFIKMIKPYFESTGLKVEYCFAGYGSAKQALVQTPHYKLFEQDDPFDISFKLTYWFSTKNEELSCTSYLESHSKRPLGCQQVVQDLLRKTVQEQKQDGISFPLTNFNGFIYFASTDFAIPLMRFIGNLLEKLGPETMDELTTIHREYQNQIIYGEEETVQGKVFKDAYERRVEEGLIKAKFIEPKLTIVK